MTDQFSTQAARLLARGRAAFTPRRIVIHDGRALRRVTIAAKTQAIVASAAAVMLGFSGYGVAQAATTAAVATGLAQPAVAEAKLVHMEQRIGHMQRQVATIRETAALHAVRVEKRQKLLAAALTGKGDAKELALATLAIDPAADRVAADTIAPLKHAEDKQAMLAKVATRVVETKLAATRSTLREMGLRPDRVARKSAVPAMGGPLVAASSAEASADLAADAQFRTLFQTWKRLDGLEQGSVAIPSVQPVHNLNFSSNFGIRSDPFRGTAAMHSGVDIPGPLGTPIYATADGIISHAGRQGGYGNLIEINHGKGIATRYGHLSKIIVADNSRVTRGQLIGLMGSTGRSTGSHLHYEVRIDGHAVNPIPFLTTADYLLASQDSAIRAIPVSTGPAPLD